MTAVHVARETSRLPALTRIKRVARAQALDLGHVLGRFHTETEGDDGYSIARCVGCLRAVAISRLRYANRFGSGPALRERCPTPVQITDEHEEEANDDA